jgi:anti-sigma regulatory factor (Ser/Thr protein kinase)
VTAVITIPPSLDDGSFEQVIDQLAATAPDQKILVDARHTRWASPYGLTGLLTLAHTRAERPQFAPPEAEETLSYWGRTNFFRYAEELYDFTKRAPRARDGGESSVLLEITPLAQAGDVHTVVERIGARAQAILQGELNLDIRATMGFSMTLSEACQNVIEHAGGPGWVAVQTYTWRQRLGRRVVVIAVSDSGVGFRRSLESAQGTTRSDRWDDGMALEEAVMRGVSRFKARDPGRGQGLKGIRTYVGKWDSKLSVRSGTARIALVPAWDDDQPMREKLSEFPGAQMQITIPQRVAAPPGETTTGTTARRAGARR